MEGQKTIVKTKTYTTQVIEYSDGTKDMIRKNDGFEPLELIGIGDLIGIEVREQLMGRLNIDTITREFVVDSKEE